MRLLRPRGSAGSGGPDGDRRAAGRRSGREPSVLEESWFSALDAPATASGDDEASRSASRVLRPAAGDALRRIFGTYIVARLILGIALAAASGVAAAAGGRLFTLGSLVCIGYAVQAGLWWLVSRLQRSARSRSGRWQWAMTIGVDLLVFSALHLNDPFSNLNFGVMLVLPVLMAGVLTPRLPALATTACVALMLLAAAARGAMESNAEFSSLMPQAGLIGVGLFVVALLTGELSMRLAHEERTARDSRERARQQAQLSRLVIEDMADGVLVVDRQLRVRAANPSARKLLVAQLPRCPSPPFSLRLHAGWVALADEVERAFARGDLPAGAQDLSLMLEDGTRRTLQIRGRFTRGSGESDGVVASGERLCVLFLEELKAVQARLRQERLAGMGRISAGIAHEIRNPLAAIAQANALLGEDELRADQRRLVRIMTDNIDRLKRIVDDVMEVAPGAATPTRVLDASAEVSAICSEWARTVGLVLGSESRLLVKLPSVPLGIAFDADHLRRVLVNLLDNAIRHATLRPNAVRLTVKPTPDNEWVRVAVSSDGDPIPADVEPYLFEPFHSTRSRGTGLGLYICRELCERHGARIDFRRRTDRHSNVFEVMIRRETLSAAEGRLVL